MLIIVEKELLSSLSSNQNFVNHVIEEFHKDTKDDEIDEEVQICIFVYRISE